MCKRFRILAMMLTLSMLLPLSSCFRFTCTDHQYDGDGVCTECGEAYVDPGIEFRLLGSSYAVSGYTGNSEVLHIPSQYQGLPVTTVDSLGSNQELKTVTIPDSVMFLEYTALSWQSNLRYNEYDNACYLGNSKNPYLVLVKAKDTSITSCKVHENTKIIYADAFSRCTALASVVLSESVETIGTSAFDGCDSLQFTVYDQAQYLGTPTNAHYALISTVSHEVLSCATHPDTKLIAGGAFFGDLESITLSDKITNIGEMGFSSCENLTELVLPESLVSISWYALSGCSQLNRITIPKSVKMIDQMAFGFGYSGELSVHPENTVYHVAGNCLIETESKTLIATGKNPVIPNDGSVEYIAPFVFGMRRLASDFVIPEGVKRIGEYAFYAALGLDDLSLPQSLERIDEGAFQRCLELENLTVPKNVTYIGERAFSGCTDIQYMAVDPENQAYFLSENCLIERESKTLIWGGDDSAIPKNGAVEIIGDFAFECSNITSVSIPDGVTEIGEWAFFGCHGLKEITLPNSLSSIGNYVFYYVNSALEIRYMGTKAQWEALVDGVELGNSKDDVYTVICSDGTITVEG